MADQPDDILTFLCSVADGLTDAEFEDCDAYLDIDNYEPSDFERVSYDQEMAQSFNRLEAELDVEKAKVRACDCCSDIRRAEEELAYLDPSR